MMALLECTKDTTGLIKSEGYWSNKEIYFNPTEKIVIIDQSFTINDIEPMIDVFLDKYMNDAMVDFINKKLPEEASMEELLGKYHHRINGIVSVSKIPFFEKDEFKHEGIFKYYMLGRWLDNKFCNRSEAISYLAGIISQDWLTDGFSRSEGKTSASIIMLSRKIFRTLLRDIIESSSSIEVVLSFIVTFTYDVDSVSGVSTLRKGAMKKVRTWYKALLNECSEKGVSIKRISGDKYLDNYENFISVRLGMSHLCGLLAMNNVALFPASIEPKRSRDPFIIVNSWYSKLITDGYLIRRGASAALMRLFMSSELLKIDDIPTEIRALTSYITESRALLAILPELLANYSSVTGKPEFPVTKLSLLKRRKDRVQQAYTPEWMKENGIPTPWVEYASILFLNSKLSLHLFRGKLKHLVDWGWYKCRFSSPFDIQPTDLRDPHKPEREDTFFKYLFSLSLNGKNECWTATAHGFKIVTNAMKLKGVDVIDPFSYHIKSPFSQTKPAVTYRTRIPNNIHAAMLHVLLSPDENGKPTYDFVKNELKWDWFNWINPETSKVEKTWCPSRARCLAFLMSIPVRGKQARWLDQGLLDKYIWDPDTQRMEVNTHPLRNWAHPETGQSHEEIYRRDSGVLQILDNIWSADKSLSIYVCTNKTQMWDPNNKTGYPIHWPRSEQLEGVEIIEQSEHMSMLNRPYKIIEEQIRWLKKYDPDPEPVTFEDSTYDLQGVVQGLVYPYFTPLFRDLSSAYHRSDNKSISLPPQATKLYRLYSAIAVEAERRLSEQGITLSFTTETNSRGEGYFGRKCIFDIHSLRVFGVSYLVEIGVPVEVVRTIVGHETIAMTLHYQKLSAEFIRNMLAGKVVGNDMLDTWDMIGESLLAEQQKFIALNPGFSKDDIDNNLLERDYTGFVQKPGGMCPLGGTACSIGQVIKDSANVKDRYGPVSGGCGNCRFFCTTPAHLFQHQMVVNDLFIQIRSLGKQQTVDAQRLSELKLKEQSNRSVINEIDALQSRLEEKERITEPLVREWMNRTNMINQCIQQLDEFISFAESQQGGKKQLMLLSHSTAKDLHSEIEFRLEKTGEYELARQSLLAAHLSGGIDQCQELTKRQLREFMDRIMIHDDPSLLLLKIQDEKTRDKVAFLMSEAMAATVGTEFIQKALTDNSGLNDLDITVAQKENLSAFINGLFINAEKQGSSSTFESLLTNNFEIIGRDK